MGFHINVVLHNTQNTNILKLHHIKGGTNKKINVIQKLYIILQSLFNVISHNHEDIDLIMCIWVDHRHNYDVNSLPHQH
jgi:hypothetical protein